LHRKIENVRCHPFTSREVEAVFTSAEPTGGHDLVNSWSQFRTGDLDLIGKSYLRRQVSFDPLTDFLRDCFRRHSLARCLGY